MFDALLLVTEVVLGSPWLLVVITALAVVDALLPVVPSEVLIMAAGVASAAGEQDLFLVIAAAGFGAFLGEVAGYAIGRAIGPGLRTRLRPDSARAHAFDTVTKLLVARGGTVLLTARFIPAGRTVATLTAGATGYPGRPFLTYTAVGATLSAAYVAVLGFLGGIAFAQDTLMALLFSFGLAVTVGLVVEAGRRVFAATAARSEGGPPAQLTNGR